MEPYLERLSKIHALFAEGKTPADILKIADLKVVYEAERCATGALLSFYKHSVNDPFDKVIEAVKDFAKADAERLRLRARLRAEAIAGRAKPGKDMYIESGYIHYTMYLYLRRELGPQQKIRVLFLLQPVVKRLKGRRRNMGPGDILTLRYSFHSHVEEGLANLLAARSLIYIKLISKEELIPGPSDCPHSEDEVMVNRLVDCLGFAECGEIFEKVRFKRREQALRIVRAHVKSKETSMKFEALPRSE